MIQHHRRPKRRLLDKNVPFHPKSKAHGKFVPASPVGDDERRLFVDFGMRFDVQELYVVQALCYYVRTKAKLRPLVLSHGLPVVVLMHVFLAVKWLDEELQIDFVASAKSVCSNMDHRKYCDAEWYILTALDWDL